MLKRLFERSPAVVPILIATGLLAGCQGNSGPSELTRTNVTVLVPGSSFHGIHGITVRNDGQLFAGSVVGAATYQIDPSTGNVTTYIESPFGMADDLEFSPDGSQLAWTSFLMGKVHARKEGGEPGQIIELASGVLGANSIAYRADGRLFFTQVFLGDALWELDPTGENPPRKILDNLGGLNGFDFGADGLLYGPLWFDHRVVSVDVDSGVVTTVADGFGTPAAVNFDSQQRLWVVDTERGEVVRIDVETGEKQRIASLDPSIDNLAFGPDDTLYITNMAHNAIYQIDTTTGSARTIVEGHLAMPGGLALWPSEDGSETLYLADTFAYRTIDTESGVVTAVRLMHGQPLDQLDYPIGASVNAGHVLLSSWSSSTVQVVDRVTGESLEMLHGFNAPVAAIELPDGRMVVAEAATASLVVVAANATVAQEAEQSQRARHQLISQLGLPTDLARVQNEPTSVYCSEALAGVISKINVDTGERQVVAEGLAMPEGIDVLSDGRLVVAEVGKRRLVAIDLVSGATQVLAEDLPIGLTGPEGAVPTYIPTGVAVGSDAVYITSDIDNSILKVRL